MTESKRRPGLPKMPSVDLYQEEIFVTADTREEAERETSVSVICREWIDRGRKASESRKGRVKVMVERAVAGWSPVRWP